MKNQIICCVFANVLFITTALSCPQGFSPNDQRPFFEQYETENNTVTPQEKEKSS